MINVAGYSNLQLIEQTAETLVYSARRSSDGGQVILRHPRPEVTKPEKLLAYRREFEILRDIESSYVVRAVELIEKANTPILVMESIGGSSLSSLMEERSLSYRETISIAVCLAQGLDDVHANNVIHKNICPQNIVYNPESGQVQIIDFGIASNTSTTLVAQPGTTVEGTLGYIAPEQTGRLNRSTDYRADFYSLGATLHEMLAGEPPFSKGDSLEIVYQHITSKPPDLTTLAQDMPAGLANVVNKLLEKMPEDRYQSAFAIKQDLARCGELLDQGPTAQEQTFEVALDDIPEQLIISERLLERREQLAQLREGFARTRQGDSVLIACEGAAGTGKSSLIRELQKDVTIARGFFVTAKLNNLSPDQPYGGLASACADLTRQLLARPDIETTRARIEEQIEGNGAILRSLAPELKLILGDEPDRPERLRPEETRSRLIQGLAALIRTVCNDQTPIVLSIENLHWLDRATLDLFEPLIAQERIPHFMLVCTYIQTELAASEDMRHIMAQLSQYEIELIKLANLSVRGIAELISDSLYRPVEETTRLAQIVHNKTGGNPLAVREFITAMEADGVLYFDRQHREWTCDLVRAAQMPPTDNVSNLLATKIEQLEPATANLLKIASCAGEEFDLDTIRSVSEMSFSECSARLVHAVREGYLVHKLVNAGTRDERVHYQFAHERIQQAAYTLLTSTQKRQIHTSIGHAYLKNSENEEGDNVFRIVNQLNNSFESPDPSFVDRNKLAQLNTTAGKRAKNAAAFQSAYKYFRTAIALQGQNVWANYEPSMDLHIEAAETAYLCGDLQQLDVLVDRCLEHARSPLDRVRALEVKLRALVACNELDATLEMGHQCLALLDHPLKMRLGVFDLISTICRLIYLTGRLRSTEVPAQSTMTDPDLLTVMRILMILCQAGYLNGSPVTGLYILKMTQLSLKHGLAPETSFAYPMFAALLISNLGTIDKGYRLGVLAEQNLREDNRELHCKTILLVTNFIKPWKHHLRETLEPLSHAYRIGMETGDVEFALIAAVTGSANAFLLGHDLNSLDTNLANYNQKASEFNQTPTLSLGSIFQQATRNLLEPNAAPWLLEGEIYSENDLLQFHEDSGDESSVANLYIVKLFLAVLFNHREHGISFAREARSRLASVVSSPTVPFFVLYETLAYLFALEHENRISRRLHLHWRIFLNRRILRKWSHHAPENILHGFYLIEAEHARLNRNYIASLDFYDQAISLAEAHGYIKEVGLANERCGRFHLASGKRDLAIFYLQQARANYLRWGAQNKVNALDTEFVELATDSAIDQKRQRFSQGGARLGNPAFRDYGNYLDLGSVIKASQVLSGEIILDNLLERLMQVALENAGAHSASLILSHDDELVLEISTRNEGSTSHHERSSIPIKDAKNLPISVVQYVVRTQEDLVLNDALNEDVFTQDEYIISRQPKSILCIPILSKSHLTGVLYLENLQTTLAFTQERVAILKLLASQSAIAIENAKLYQQLNESRNKYLSLYQNAVEGIFEMNSDGKVTNLNPAAAQLLGFDSPEQAIGRVEFNSEHTLVDPTDRDFLRETLAEQRRLVGYEMQIRRRDGETLWVALSAQAFKEPGHGYRIEGSIIDITERKLREDAEQATRIAQAATESKSQFLANMSHEIRTPMNAITGYTDLALRTSLSEQQRNYLETIRNSSSHLLRVVNDILDLSKVESGKLELQHVPFKLAGIFSDLQRLFGLEAAERNLTLIIPDPEAVPDTFYVGDPVRIGQVLINLVSNALKFTDSGTVEVDYDVIQLTDNRICINFTVSDTGIGIAENDLELVFESFAQGSIATPNAGTGLGLAICKSLVEMMEGHIHAVSEKDVGSSFYFSIIVDAWDQLETPAKATRREAQTSHDHQRVLLVEDNQINLDLAREVLINAGLTVEIAMNGQEALDALSRQSFTAILMDLRMPEMDGLEAIQRIRANPATKDLPAVALSAGVLKEEVEAALGAGFDYYLSKPVDFQELLELLQRVGDVPRVSEPDPEPVISLPPIDGIDLAAALKNHNNDFELLTRLLGDFESLYGDAGDSLGHFLAEQNYAAAERLAHNIAGVSGSFGSARLMAAARAIEQQLITEDPPGDTNASLEEFRNELARFLSAIRAFKATIFSSRQDATG